MIEQKAGAAPAMIEDGESTAGRKRRRKGSTMRTNPDAIPHSDDDTEPSDR